MTTVQNKEYFSSTETSPLGLSTFLHNAIAAHDTSKFCDKVLRGRLDKEDKASINNTEVYELIQHMVRLTTANKQRTPTD